MYNSNLILPTLDILPQDKPNCGNCDRKGGPCLRQKSNKEFAKGYVYSRVTGQLSGMITLCMHYSNKGFNFNDSSLWDDIKN